MDMNKRLEFAVKIAKEAGNFTLEYYDRPGLRVDRKGDGTPVTDADRGAEKLLRQRIAEAFPDDAILGEEFPCVPGTSGLRWILDPIDGTKSFIHGVPFYSTLIGVEKYDTADPDNHKKSEMLAGVIWLPALQRGVWAQKGFGAFEERPGFDSPLPAKVSSITTLEEACFLTSEVKTFAETSRAAVYTELENSCRLTRTWGDAYGYYLVATGRADLMVDPEMSPWDCGPLVTILAEAGGKFVDWRGSETIYGGDGVAGNRELVKQALEFIIIFDVRDLM